MIWLDQLRLTSVQKLVRLLLLILTSKSRENRNSALGNSFLAFFVKQVSKVQQLNNLQHFTIYTYYIFIGYQPNKMIPEEAKAFHREVLEG